MAFFALTALLRAESVGVDGEYRCNAGFACLDLSLRPDGTFSAVLKTDIGDVGSAAGKWKKEEKEVRLTPSTATGPFRNYFTVLLESDCEGQPALIRKEDLSQKGSRLFSFLKKKSGANQPPQGTPGTVPSSSTEPEARRP